MKSVRLYIHIIKYHKQKWNKGNPAIRIYVNKKENRITFKIKTGYYLELLTPQTMKLIKTNDKNGENVSHLKFTEVVLVHCINFNNDYKHDSRVL